MPAPHPDFEKSIKLMTEHIEALQREFGHVYTKKNLISASISYPKNEQATQEIRTGVHSLINGALMVYIFAMWDAHTPRDIDEWLEEDELNQIRAYRHIRNSVAHGYKGTRADSWRNEFETKMPFDEIEWDTKTDTIDISKSSAPLRCFDFMGALNKKLVVRLHNNKKP